MIKNEITIVSGLPRSGTSMMMKMLEAGGMTVLTDHLRTADDDNPKGYYEFERVKQIKTDQAWLPAAQGKAVKMISELLQHLPPAYQYRVLFMRRKLEETLASQKQTELFHRHLQKLEGWLAAQPNFRTLEVHYSEVMLHPRAAAEKINAFLFGALDVAKMVAVVDPALHRQKT
jgi:hypothetical protein